ncbi:hypothetical protein L798_13070 [Zootermopsis nevadensis]|uniref:Uncharacterized protein n=1 Tax=Zootermopsis nevadensis TaxID=136037 RepID=A0A067QSV6_ZOONE|nr:hypothetical protein L798_13070 [Zootermopsis nevadensis]
MGSYSKVFLSESLYTLLQFGPKLLNHPVEIYVQHIKLNAHNQMGRTYSPKSVPFYNRPAMKKSIKCLGQSRGWQRAVFWFCFIEENFDAPVEVGTDQNVTPAALGTLSHDGIFHSQILAGIRGSFALLDLSDDIIRIRSKHGARDHSIVRFDPFPEIISVPANRREF